MFLINRISLYVLIAVILGAAITSYAAEGNEKPVSLSDFDLSGDAAPYEAAKFLAEKSLLGNGYQITPEYEIPVYSPYGEVVGYYFIGYKGPGNPPPLRDLIDGLAKELSKVNEGDYEKTSAVLRKYDGYIRTFTVYTKFGYGGPMTGSCDGLLGNILAPGLMETAATEALGGKGWGFKYCDFEGFTGAIYEKDGQFIYLPFGDALIGKPTIIRSIEELRRQYPFAGSQEPGTMPPEEMRELKRTWWREVLEQAIGKIDIPSTDGVVDLDSGGKFDFPISWGNGGITTEGPQWWDDNNPPSGGSW